MNPTLVLAQSGTVYPVNPVNMGPFFNLASPDGSQWLAAPLPNGLIQWVPQGTKGPTVNWVPLSSGYYRCTPDNGATPIAFVVKILGPAPTAQG